MVPLALRPFLFCSQHVGELGQQVAFILPNEHGMIVHPSITAVALALNYAPDRRFAVSSIFLDYRKVAVKTRSRDVTTA